MKTFSLQKLFEIWPRSEIFTTPFSSSGDAGGTARQLFPAGPSEALKTRTRGVQICRQSWANIFAPPLQAASAYRAPSSPRPVHKLYLMGSGLAAAAGRVWRIYAAAATLSHYGPTDGVVARIL
jgi:hypothetical protein